MSAPTMTAPVLKRVARSFHLLLPEFVGGPSRAWLKPGDILDVSDPFVAFATQGQVHKLEDLRADELDSPPAATPYSIKMLENARLAWMKKHAPELAPAEPAPAPKAKGAAGIQKPDPRPTKPTA